MEKSILKYLFLFTAVLLIITLVGCPAAMKKNKKIGKIHKHTDLFTDEIWYEKQGDLEKWYQSEDHHGTVREWYGSETEPTDCHIVMVIAGQGPDKGKLKVECSGKCDGDLSCKLVEELRIEDSGTRIEEMHCDCK